MKDKLNELIRIIKEREVAENIIAAADTEAKFLIYESEKKYILEELECFTQAAGDIISVGEAVINESEEYCISAEDAVPFCLVCMMTGLDDCDILEDYHELVKALEEVEGPLAETAKDLADFLDTGSFSEEDIEELLEKLW